ncbi:hypothetical protein ABK040_016560 [Willaertia magna]
MSTSSREVEERNFHTIIHRLKADNDSYQRNFDNLKREYLELHNLSNDQHVRWKSQLERKTKEFETLRSQFDKDTAELQNLKMKLMEELEIRHRLEKDMEDNDKYRDLYSDLRREFEMYKNDMSQKLKLQEKKYDEMKLNYEEKIQEYTIQLNSSCSTGRTTNEIKQLKKLEEEREELSIKVKQLLKEMVEVRDEKAHAIAAKEQANLVNTQKFSELLSKSRNLETQNERLLKKNERLQLEVDDLSRSNDKMHEQILKLENEVTTLKSKIEEGEKRYQSERNSQKSNQLLREREFERERGTLMNKINELNKRMDELQATRQDLLNQISDIQMKENEKTQEIIRKEKEKYLILEIERNELKQENISKEKHFTHEITVLTSEITRLRKEQEIISAENSTLRDEKEYQIDKSSQLSKLISDLRFDIDTYKHKYQEINMKLEKSYQELQHSKENSKKLVSKIRKIKSVYKGKIKSLQLHVEQLNEQLIQSESSHSTVQQTCLSEKQQLQKKIFDLERERDRYKILSQETNQL